MKLFQRLLLAPAALGLLAPIAANAAELNINDVANYAPQSARTLGVNSRAQFSDVVPGDWAYTALTNLSESYGCLDNNYSQSLQSGQPLTRYEAAALVNACLDGGIASAASNSDVMRLSNEFGAEMAILKGRVDGLESQINELSAGQFSPTTKMSGRVAMVAGYVDYETDANSTPGGEALALNYSFRVELNSSFTGKDRMYTRLMTGNMGPQAGTTGDSPWGSKTYGTYLAVANSNDETIKLDKLWYEFPLGGQDQFRVYVGPKIENYYILAQAPSIYKPVMKQFALGGNAGAYASSTDAGVGLTWSQPTDSYSQPKWSVSTGYVSKGGEDATQGMFTDVNSKWLSQLAYGGPTWGVSYAYAVHNCSGQQTGTQEAACNAWSSYYSTDLGNNVGVTGETATSIRGYWKPSDNGIIPQIQLGVDWRDLEGVTANSTEAAPSVLDTLSWMTGLTWPDALGSKRIGVAIGQRESGKGFKNAGGDGNSLASVGKDNASGWTWEAYYDYEVNDYTTITPTIFGGTNVYDGTNDDIFGALVQTVFKF